MKKQHKTAPDDNQKARVLKISECVNYQAGSIVSRELLKQKTGSVTLFAFDEGQSVSEHTAPFDALVIGLEGELEVFIAGEPNRINKDDMIIMPAGMPHGIKSLGPSKMLLVMIKA